MNDVLIELFLTVLTVLMVVGIAYLKSLANKNEQIKQALDMLQGGKEQIYQALITELGQEQADLTVNQLIDSINQLEDYAIDKIVEALHSKFEENNINITEEQIYRLANIISAQLKVL